MTIVMQQRFPVFVNLFLNIDRRLVNGVECKWKKFAIVKSYTGG